MALVQYGGGGDGDYWSRFQPHDDSGGPSPVNGGFTGMADGLQQQGGYNGAIGRQPLDLWHTMSNRMPETIGGQPQGGQSVSIDQLKQLIGEDYSAANLTRLLPQLQAMGIEVQNQGQVIPGTRDLRPRFLLPGGEQWDFGAGGWVNSGHGIGAGFKDGGGSSGAPGAPGGGQSGGILGALQDTPGYKFQYDESMRGVERSAFAKGTGLTGGTLKALQDRAAGLAGTRYDTTLDHYYRGAQLGQNAINQGSS